MLYTVVTGIFKCTIWNRKVCDNSIAAWSDNSNMANQGLTNIVNVVNFH